VHDGLIERRVWTWGTMKRDVHLSDRDIARAGGMDAQSSPFGPLAQSVYTRVRRPGKKKQPLVFLSTTVPGCGRGRGPGARATLSG